MVKTRRVITHMEGGTFIRFYHHSGPRLGNKWCSRFEMMVKCTRVDHITSNNLKASLLDYESVKEINCMKGLFHIIILGRPPTMIENYQ